MTKGEKEEILPRQKGCLVRMTFLSCHPELYLRNPFLDEVEWVPLLKDKILRGVYTEQSECAQNDKEGKECEMTFYSITIVFQRLL
jgi:hypothetical protein